MAEEGPLVLGTDVGAVRSLAETLGGWLVALPDDPDDRVLEAWRAEVAAGPAWGRIVVAVWQETPAPAPLLDLSPDEWTARAEGPLLAWNLAIGAAAARYADGGAIVAVAEAPAPLDSAGFAPESGLADAVSALCRSVAQAEGARAVRANIVTTPARLTTGDVVTPARLASFPGRLDPEVVGAVRLLLSEEASGVTGRTLVVDAGRSR